MTDYMPVINRGYYQIISGIGTRHRWLRQRHLGRRCAHYRDIFVK